MKSEAVEHILSNVMKLDEDAAKLIADALENAKPPGQDDGMGGGFGGGFGGNEPPIVPEDQGDDMPEEQGEE